MSYIKIQKIKKENIGVPEKGYIYFGYDDDVNTGKGLWIKDDDGSAAYHILAQPVITGFNPTTAYAGDNISIIGYNFISGQTTVTFNGFFASVVFLSTTEISVIIPYSISGGVADVVVSTINGSSSPASFIIIVTTTTTTTLDCALVCTINCNVDCDLVCTINCVA
jgi:hypothetical protein